MRNRTRRDQVAARRQSHRPGLRRPTRTLHQVRHLRCAGELTKEAPVLQPSCATGWVPRLSRGGLLPTPALLPRKPATSPDNWPPQSVSARAMRQSSTNRPQQPRQCISPELPTRNPPGEPPVHRPIPAPRPRSRPAATAVACRRRHRPSDILSRPGYSRYASLTPITAATAARRVIKGGPNQMHNNTPGTPHRAVRTRWSSTRFTPRRYGPGCPGSRNASAFAQRRSARDPNLPRPGPAKAPACGNTHCRPPAR